MITTDAEIDAAIERAKLLDGEPLARTVEANGAKGGRTRKVVTLVAATLLVITAARLLTSQQVGRSQN
jgi:hypothetical protein